LVLGYCNFIDGSEFSNAFKDKLMLKGDIRQVEAVISIDCYESLDKADLLYRTFPKLVDLLIGDHFFADICEKKLISIENGNG
jgi:hypothetical protein